VASKENPYIGDPLTLEAKKRGYPARSVFKLEEIHKRVELFRPKMKVLDLGAAPGSWALFASQKVGTEGRVLAVDLQEITQRFGPNVRVVQGDAFDLGSAALGEFAPYDVVMSDMAPKTSGIKMRDQAMSYELFELALQTAKVFGRSDRSAFVCKIFMGPDFNQAMEQTKRAFSKVRVIRPSGVRPNSKEVYLVASAPRAGSKPDEAKG
jgi:23S rRNA (uridine2552-2'-O)-methyltransferase